MKTGGTSLNRMFQGYFGADRSWPRATDAQLRRFQKFDPAYLVDMHPAERAELRYVSMHTGAWVADALFPDLLSVTVLRDPVERTISHLRQLADLPQTPDDLEAIYAEPVWHARLVDHQTQVFASSEAELREQRARRHEYDPDRLPESEREAIRAELWAGFTTTISAPRVIDERTFAEAEARLERIDEVGVTERLDDLVDRVAQRLGCPLPEVGQENAAVGRGEVPAGLRERIEAENRWDRRLYERARERTGI
jgi:hypothetical protein